MFVYGTLRKDSTSPMAHIIDEYCDLIGEAYIHGSLYDLGTYPGVITGDEYTGKVFGQLFLLKDERKVLSEFDYYEECSDDFPKPHLYIREALDVYFPNGGKGKAWVYIYNRDVSDATFIPEGDYIDYLARKR
ncbi:gamma-glutamylcyclotransferase [Sneathiella sp. P13V-1]|uniref:gamma-glutamylcyclotransferase family protein n=1 Tax=Sneathiella sp. P13V-1 TaxID=2697366 RepID=UPI001D0F54B9|nr:gamma-glutamylcyclotransferase family protein [Sneathiella sp. P13V-1]